LNIQTYPPFFLPTKASTCPRLIIFFINALCDRRLLSDIKCTSNTRMQCLFQNQRILSSGYFKYIKESKNSGENRQDINEHKDSFWKLILVDCTLFKLFFVFVSFICFDIKFCELFVWNAFVKTAHYIEMKNENQIVWKKIGYPHQNVPLIEILLCVDRLDHVHITKGSSAGNTF
jgi:hypothetical protein